MLFGTHTVATSMKGASPGVQKNLMRHANIFHDHEHLWTCINEGKAGSQSQIGRDDPT
jgi:hypothetical protein